MSNEVFALIYFAIGLIAAIIAGSVMYCKDTLGDDYEGREALIGCCLMICVAWPLLIAFIVASSIMLAFDKIAKQS